MGLMIDHAHGGSPHEIPIVGGLGHSRLVNSIHSRRGRHPSPVGTDAPVLGTLPDLTLVALHLAAHLCPFHAL